MRRVLALLAITACAADRPPTAGGAAGSTGKELVMLEVVQMLAGRDFAIGDAAASQMVNFTYLVVDPASRECVLVDPAWDIDGLLARIRREGLVLVGAVATHAHWDHVGGRFAGHDIEGVAELVARAKVPIWVNEGDAADLRARTGVEQTTLRVVKDGETLKVGGGELRFLHTPGHTPGCQCLLTDKAVITGDTLFVDECGRVDLPGSEPKAMERSLRRLAALPAETVVYPGHDYGPTPTSTIGEQRRTNPTLRPGAFD